MTSLEVNCHGRDVAIAIACAELLRSLTLRCLKLAEFMLGVAGPSEEYVADLTAFLSSQGSLQHAALPIASATSEVVRALGSLPYLREYANWGDVEYQDPAHVGMEFDWDPEFFESLEELRFYAPSLPKASQIVAKRNGPLLRRLQLTCLSWFEPNELERLTTALATFHPNLTLIRLSLFALLEDHGSSRTISFAYIRPLLHCTALSTLLLRHSEPLVYTEEDVATMGLAWPGMLCLQLCQDPTDDCDRTEGLSLRIIGVLIQTFPKLEELAVYINAAGALCTPRSPRAEAWTRSLAPEEPELWYISSSATRSVRSKRRHRDVLGLGLPSCG